MEAELARLAALRIDEAALPDGGDRLRARRAHLGRCIAGRAAPAGHAAGPDDARTIGGLQGAALGPQAPRGSGTPGAAAHAECSQQAGSPAGGPGAHAAAPNAPASALAARDSGGAPGARQGGPGAGARSLQSAAPAPPDLLQAALRTPLPPASACASAPQAGPAADERGAGGAGPSAGAQQRAGQGPPPAAEPRPPAPALPAGRGGKHVGGAARAPSTGPHPGAQGSAAEAARRHAQARAMKARLAALVAALGDPAQLAALPDGGRQVDADRFLSERPETSSCHAVTRRERSGPLRMRQRMGACQLTCLGTCATVMAARGDAAVRRAPSGPAAMRLTRFCGRCAAEGGGRGGQQAAQCGQGAADTHARAGGLPRLSGHCALELSHCVAACTTVHMQSKYSVRDAAIPCSRRGRVLFWRTVRPACHAHPRTHARRKHTEGDLSRSLGSGRDMRPAFETP